MNKEEVMEPVQSEIIETSWLCNDITHNHKKYETAVKCIKKYFKAKAFREEQDHRRQERLELADKMIQMRKEGKTLETISEEVGLSPTRISQIITLERMKQERDYKA